MNNASRRLPRLSLALYLLCALLLASGVALIATHLRPDHNMSSVALSASLAAPRAAERMRVERPGGAVNVNLADMDELCELPGVGPATARYLIEEREANGPFAYAEDLLSVRGIGQKTLQKLLPQICLE